MGAGARGEIIVIVVFVVILWDVSTSNTALATGNGDACID